MQIERLVRRGNSVDICFDTGDKLVIAYEVALNSSLRKGDSISEAEIQSLQKENELYLLKRSALNILQRRMHSKRELRTKLLKKSVDKALIDSVIEYLVENKYLDEERFTELFIHEKFSIRKNGVNKVRSELFRKGIPREIIDRQIELSITEDESLENALVLANKRASRLNSLDIQKKKQKLFSFLSSRGYQQSVIFRVFSALDLND